MALGRPVSAERRAWIGWGTVKRGKRDPVGLRVPNESGIAIWKPNQNLGPVGLHKIRVFPNKPLGGVWYVQERNRDLNIDHSHDRGEPQIMHQPVFLDVLQTGFG